MKKLILLSCLISFSSFAANGKSDEVIASYQELCAKEQDPVKRRNYCYMLENSDQSHTKSNIFRQDIAVV